MYTSAQSWTSSACSVWKNVKHEGDQSETFIVSHQHPVETQWSVWSEVVLTGGWKTNGEVTETEKKNTLGVDASGCWRGSAASANSFRFWANESERGERKCLKRWTFLNELVFSALSLWFRLLPSIFFQLFPVLSYILMFTVFCFCSIKEMNVLHHTYRKWPNKSKIMFQKFWYFLVSSPTSALCFLSLVCSLIIKILIIAAFVQIYSIECMKRLWDFYSRLCSEVHP